MVKCPSGYQIGTDWQEFNECVYCENTPFYYCKKMRESCVGKVDYRLQERADQAAYRISLEKGIELTSYLCKYCGQFHIGRDWGV